MSAAQAAERLDPAGAGAPRGSSLAPQTYAGRTRFGFSSEVAGGPSASSATATEPEGDDGAPVLRSIREAARFFGVTERTVHEWINHSDYPCPVVSRGDRGKAYELDLAAVAAWREQRKARDAAELAAREEAEAALQEELFGADALQAEAPAGGHRLNAKQIRDLVDAQKALQLLEMERGTLVKVAEIEVALARAFDAVAVRLTALPDELAGKFGLDRGVVAAIAEAIDDALTDAAERGARAGRGGDDARAA